MSGSSLGPGNEGEPDSVKLGDTAARELAEEQLAISEEQQRLLDEHANDVIWTMSLDGRITYVSPSVEKVRGFTPEEAMNQPLGEILTPDSTAVMMAQWQELAVRLEAGLSPQEFHGEYEHYCRDGSSVWTEVQCIPHVDAHGEMVELVGVTRDISERKRAEDEIRRLRDELEERVLLRTAQLEETNRELEAFIYSAAHDLLTSLRAIDGFSQMVADDAAERLEPADVEHLQRVRTAAQRMGLLLDHLLVLSRTGAGDLVIEQVDISAVATAILDELRLREPQRRVEVVVQPGLVAEAGGETAFFIRDDGAGFEQKAAEHIFGAFQRLHTSDEFVGDGIGLATVTRLVAKHGGSVWAEAEVETGATFFFTLPGPPGSV